MMSDFNFQQLKPKDGVKAICSCCAGEVVIRKEDTVKIGKYTIIKWSEGEIWISARDGQGCQFKEKEIEKEIERFYLSKV